MPADAIFVAVAALAAENTTENAAVVKQVKREKVRVEDAMASAGGDVDTEHALQTSEDPNGRKANKKKRKDMEKEEEAREEKETKVEKKRKKREAIDAVAVATSIMVATTAAVAATAVVAAATFSSPSLLLSSLEAPLAGETAGSKRKKRGRCRDD